MPQPTENPRADCRVVISDDKLSAYLSPIGDEAVEVELDVIRRRVAESGLHLTLDQLNPSINPFRVSGNLFRIDSKILIVRGQPPVASKNASLELIDEIKAPLASGDPDTPDHYHRCHIRVVKNGQQLARYVPAVFGKPGVDVFSADIPAETSNAPPATLGQNVAHDPVTQIITAACDGSLILDETSVSVDPLIHVKKNVDFSTGNINFTGDVLIEGSVLDLFEVQGANISVHGAVEAAKLKARGNIHVDGGILGKEKGVVRAEADLAARFITNAKASAAGNITVLSEVTNSEVFCGGKITVAKGAIVGGTLIANGGVEARALGNASQAKTLIEVGTDPNLIDFAAGKLDQIEKQRELIQKTRVSIEPLLKNFKRLTPQQREKATELLYNADEQENILKKELQELDKRWKLAQEKCSPVVLFHKCVYPGVELRFPGQLLNVQQPLNGTARIMIKTLNSVTRMALLRDNSAHPVPLDSIPTQLHPVEKRLKALLDATAVKAA